MNGNEQNSLKEHRTPTPQPVGFFLLVNLLVAIPLLCALFYGVAGKDKFLLLSPLVIVGYLCLTMALISMVFTKRMVACSPPAFIPLLLFLGWGTYLTTACNIPYEATVRVLMVGLVIGAYFVWGNSFTLFRKNRMMLSTLLMFALLLSFYGLVNLFKQPEMVLWSERWTDQYIKVGGWINSPRLASTYICPNHFAHLLHMLLPFCLVLIFIPQAGIFLRVLACYCFVVFIPTIYYTQSRAGMLGAIMALGVTVLLLTLRKSKKLFLLLLVLVPLCSAILLAGAWKYSAIFRFRMEPVVEFVSEMCAEGFANTSTTDFRPLTWLDTIDMIKDRPIRGSGPGTYWYTYPEYRQRWGGTRVVSGHPHNEFLEVAAEYGLVGCGLLTFAWVYALVRLLIFSQKTPNEHHAFMTMAFFGTAAGTLLHSFFDFQMHEFQNALVFGLLAGIAVGPICGRRQEQQLKASGKGWPIMLRRIALSLVALVAMAGLSFSVQTFSSAFIRALADKAVQAPRHAPDAMRHAQKLYELAASIDKSNWRAYKGLGELYAVERYYCIDLAEKQALAKEERRFYEQALRWNPKDFEIAMNLGRVTAFLGDADAGIALLTQAAQTRRFNDIVWWNLGVMQRKARQYEEALETFKYTATIKNSASVRKNIQWLEKQLRGDVSDAAELRVEMKPAETPSKMIDILEAAVAPTEKEPPAAPAEKSISLDDLLDAMGSAGTNEDTKLHN